MTNRKADLNEDIRRNLIEVIEKSGFYVNWFEQFPLELKEKEVAPFVGQFIDRMHVEDRDNSIIYIYPDPFGRYSLSLLSAKYSANVANMSDQGLGNILSAKDLEFRSNLPSSFIGDFQSAMMHFNSILTYSPLNGNHVLLHVRHLHDVFLKKATQKKIDVRGYIKSMYEANSYYRRGSTSP